MDGAAGYLKNLRVKNARQPVKNRYLTCLGQGHKVSRQTYQTHTHKKRNIQIYYHPANYCSNIGKQYILTVFFFLFLRATLRVLGKQNSLFLLGPVIKCLLFHFFVNGIPYWGALKSYIEYSGCSTYTESFHWQKKYGQVRKKILLSQGKTGKCILCQRNLKF